MSARAWLSLATAPGLPPLPAAASPSPRGTGALSTHALKQEMEEKHA